MWQRIQTLYMVLALVALGIALGFTSRLPFIILLSVCALCNLLPVFTFRHRMLQMRLLLFAAVALLGLQAHGLVLLLRLVARLLVGDPLLAYLALAVLPVPKVADLREQRVDSRRLAGSGADRVVGAAEKKSGARMPRSVRSA